MTSRSRREINSSIVFAGVDGPVPHYGALDAICPETQFRLSHQSATGQGKLALGDTSGEWSARLCGRRSSHTPRAGSVRFGFVICARDRLEVLQKRASDRLSPWVGETEQQIAAAFAEARDAQAFLIFDEADSLLADRRSAHRSWEVSQVNEMLTWMESHPLPFACTTNFGDHLDVATLFKVRLDYLAQAQMEQAFRGYFDLPPPDRIRGLAALTPGDFAVVRRKAEILGQLGDPEALTGMLRAECDAKPNRPRPIGFRP